MIHFIKTKTIYQKKKKKKPTQSKNNHQCLQTLLAGQNKLHRSLTKLKQPGKSTYYSSNICKQNP
jgi:hypothetical protein